MNKVTKLKRILICMMGFDLLLINFLPLHTIGIRSEDMLKIRLSRNFGYSSGYGRIQGLFTIKASGPLELAQVFFYLDNVLLGEDNQAPFSCRFDTGDYSLGAHTIVALGYTSDGYQLESNHLQMIFVNPDEGWQAARDIMLPILAFVFGIIVLSIVLTIFSANNNQPVPPGTKRKYGISGGTICCRCQRPFELRWYMPNLFVGKLARCPFCGKWDVLAHLPLPELRQAEIDELQIGSETNGRRQANEMERFEKELDESRYLDY
jgi:hypothetical protein